MPGRSTGAAITNLVAQLKLITGAPTYWMNLENRVYQRLILPEDQKSAMPYVALAVASPVTYPEDHEGTVVMESWIVRIFGFVAENASESEESPSGIVAICNLHDDIVRAIKTDWTLGGAAEEVRLAPGFRTGGILSKYAEMELQLEIRQYLAAESIGPP